MTKSNSITCENPAENVVHDQLTEFLKSSAQNMLQVAIQAEVNEFIKAHEDLRLPTGHNRIVRNGCPNVKLIPV